MAITFDPRKDESNKRNHGISLARAEGFEAVVTVPDDRFDYGEARYRSFGFIGDSAYCLVFTIRGNDVRAISLRRAHAKEMKRYAP